jgi:hypothetical protein
MEMGYAYADVERGLAAALDVDEDTQRGPFRQRLKHLKRLGLPGVEPGKGARIEYTDEQVARLLIVLLLSEVGVDPAEAVTVIKKHWTSLFGPMVKQATDKEATAEVDPNPVFFTVRPKLMSKLSKSYPEWIGKFRRYANPRFRQDPRFRQAGAVVALEQDDMMWLCARNLTAAMTKLNKALGS